jgi:sigma-E factor negative regulatory protein RseB
LVAAGVNAAPDTPRAWLDRMSQAMENLNYEGTIVHVHGGQSDVFDIVHRVDQGRASERITSKDDTGREIIRNNDELTCIFPDRKEVVVEARDERDAAQSPLREHVPRASQINEALYQIAFAGSERVSGRDTRIIAIRPKDTWRYGYRLWLDQASAMPLKTELLDDGGRMLEQIRFTSIELPVRIPESAVKPTVVADAFVWQRTAEREELAGSKAAADWQARQLPPGFELMDRNARVAPDFPAGLRQIVYTDGLASVSVFIEMAVAASEQAEGLSQVGSANAFTTTISGHMVTAVGEVPVPTVELIATTMGPVEAAADGR